MQTPLINSGRISLLQLGLTALLLFLLAAAGNAADHREWIGLDQSEPGTPAEIRVDPEQSNENETTLLVLIHGFWVEEKQGDGEIFHEIRVPGLGNMDEIGAPDLPRLVTRLALPSPQVNPRLLDVEVMESVNFDGFLIWPQPYEELEPVEGGRPERFALNEEIYPSENPYPGEPGRADPEPSSLGGSIPMTEIVVNPMRYFPAERRLEVVQAARYRFLHEGDPYPFEPITRDRARLAAELLVNWEILDWLFPINWVFYESDYLIICPEAYHDELQPLINLKKTQGYWVQVRYTENVGPGCDDYRNAIDAWYGLAPANRDKYCLLVGDVDVIPMCVSPAIEGYPNGVNTDDLYGSVNGDDLNEEVYVGRMSVDSEADAAQQVDRIVDYQTTISLFANFKTAGLVAHKEDAPGKYEGAHESVRTAFYSNAPSFATFYGSTGASNADVSNAINDGLGLIAYRGHGSSSAWTGWNTMNEYYDTGDVAGLSNGMNPVVWSFACTNSNHGSNDAIAEVWMEQGDHGAISHYGATVASYTTANHELDRQMFKMLYHNGLEIQAQGIECAEHTMAYMEGIYGTANSWMYMLNGDPAMKIRTHGSLINDWLVLIPEQIPIEPDWPLNIQVVTAQGQPIHDAIFSVFKPGSTRDEEDEVFDNRYTDANGEATLPVSAATEGYLYFSIRDGSGHAVVDSILVSDEGTPAPLSGEAAMNFWAEPSVINGSTTLRLSQNLGRDVEITIYDVSGRSVRKIDVNQGMQSALWDGRNDSGQRVSSGVYLARIADKDRSYNARMVMVR